MGNRLNTVGIGIQDFLELRENHKFYIDKTSFIKWQIRGRNMAKAGNYYYDQFLFGGFFL